MNEGDEICWDKVWCYFLCEKWMILELGKMNGGQREKLLKLN